jgi:hypothetical protein
MSIQPTNAGQTTNAGTTPVAPHPAYRGVNFGFYARNGYYSTDQARLEVDRMASVGVNWVCVIAMVMQDTFASTRQYRDFVQTPADDELRDIIDYIHARGMQVQLRPMLECWDGTQRMHVTFPDDREILPGRPSSYVKQWFDGMCDRTLHYARLATRAGCEAYGLDSELDQIVRHNAHWKRVVSAARSVFKGHLTSSHTGMVDFLRELKRPDHWWYDLDSLGSSFYESCADGPGATRETMLERLRKPLDHHRLVAQTYGKPYYFGEIGCCAVAGAAKLPYFWANGGGYDGNEQARYLDAVCETFWSEPWWAGMFWWKWDEQNYRPSHHDDPAGDKGFTVWGKPAADTMRRWYTR